MKMMPYKKNMFQGFMSDDDKEIIQSFELCRKFKISLITIPNIETYSKPLFDRFKRLPIAKRNQPTVKRIICGLEYKLASYRLLPDAGGILNEIVENTRNAVAMQQEDQDHEKMDGKVFGKIIRTIPVICITCDEPRLYKIVPR